MVAIPARDDTYSGADIATSARSHGYAYAYTYTYTYTYGHAHTYGHAKEEHPVYRCNLSSLVWHQPSHCFLESSH